MTLGTNKFSLRVVDFWIEHGVENINDEVDEHEGCSKQENRAVDQRVVSITDGLEGEAPHTWPGKDALGEDCATQEEAGLQTDHGHDGNQRISQSVLEDNGEPAEPLRSRGSNVIGLQDLEHPRARHLCDNGQGYRAQGYCWEH